MSTHPPLEEVEEAVISAEKLLEKHGYKLPVKVSAEDLIKYFEAETPYPDISLAEVLKEPLLVVHELVELSEIKKRGFKIDKDIIVRYHEEIYEIHLKAAEIELEIALKENRLDYVAKRIKAVESWLNDPLLPPWLKEDCKRLYTTFKQKISRFQLSSPQS